MAWQLIYTSAPRSLEAGRSGFGTVARHRAISPLLVSAIERASQFSRLPGADAGRVIFCHRIIAIAGGRFHVLSAIRDAGADYTGRTNHIAHHLIAEQRETAQLGANGPSPAEVALAMNWATSWNEPPRYFEVTDEIALATLHSPLQGAAWERITGNPQQAWLLASGDASRGAYTIQPAGLDLREVFAESLRLMPERRWQTSFTTSLQPSDEPADFRWIGIEEHSPLRAQIETSGRPILNLAAPEMLPLAEAAQPVAAAPTRNDPVSMSTPAPTLEERRAAAPKAASTFARRKNSETSPEQNAEERFVPPPSRGPKWRLPAVAAILVAVLAIGGILWVKPMIERGKAREAVAARFKATYYFSDEEARQMAAKLVPQTDASRAQGLADASNRLIQKLRNANLPALDTSETRSDLEILANREGQAFPEELGRLRETVSEAQRLAQPPSSLHESRDTTALAKTIDDLRADISKLPAPPPLSALVKELHANADRRQAAGLLAMLQGRLPPPEGTLFEKAVNDFASRTSDPEAQKTIAEIRKELAALAKTPATIAEPAPVAPSPVPTAEKPAATPRPALYFVESTEKLPTIEIKELTSELSFELRSPTGEITKLEFNNQGTIRRNYQSGKDGFQIANGILTPEAGAPKQPFVLVARSSLEAKREILRVYVGFPLEKEDFFVGQSPTLVRDGASLKVTGILPVFAAQLTPSFSIIAPPGFDGSAAPVELRTDSHGEFDLQPALRELRKQITSKRAEADRLSQRATELAEGSKSLEAFKARTNKEAIILKSAEAKKILTLEAKTPAAVVGDFAKALATEWNGQTGSGRKDKVEDGPFESLRKAGHDLGEAMENTEKAKARNKALIDLILELDRKYRTPDKQDGLHRLHSLCLSLSASLGDAKELEAEIAQKRRTADEAELDARRIEISPLNSGELPPGEYVLTVKLKSTRDVKLFTFNIPPK